MTTINKTVLIVSPNFPPVNAVDMHRIRISLPFYKEYNWKPIVLCVKEKFVEGVLDPILNDTIPKDIPVYRVNALPNSWTRKIGLGNLGLRALIHLFFKGNEIIAKHKVDLVFISTTMFTTMILGRFWKQTKGVPYIIDMQDPWLSDYYKDKPITERPPKYWFSHTLARIMEPWTMRKVDGIMSVSEGYIQTLQSRYPRIKCPSMTLPFGVSELDFDIADKTLSATDYFEYDPELIHGIYVGCAGLAMAKSLHIIFSAFKKGLASSPEPFRKIRLHFIGTDYAIGKRARKTVEPIAEEYGIAYYVKEYPNRIPYFDALKVLHKADFLIMPGVNDAQYTASKIYPCILSRKPILAVFHNESRVVEILQETGAGYVVKFDKESVIDEKSDELLAQWSDMVKKLPFSPEVNWQEIAPFTAPETTRKQCSLFDAVLSSVEKL